MQALLSVMLTTAAIGGEPTNPVDVLAAMASRESGCITATEVYRVEQPTPHIQFHVAWGGDPGLRPGPLGYALVGGMAGSRLRASRSARGPVSVARVGSSRCCCSITRAITPVQPVW